MKCVMKMTRKHNYNDYQADDIICHDKVKIRNKSDPCESYIGYKGSYNGSSKQFVFEYDTDLSWKGYDRRILYYEDWNIEYLK